MNGAGLLLFNLTAAFAGAAIVAFHLDYWLRGFNPHDILKAPQWEHIARHLRALTMLIVLAAVAPFHGSLGAQRKLAWLAWPMVAVLLVCAAAYPWAPRYFDVINEPGVVTTTLKGLVGLPVHPRWSLGEGSYGTVYGPFLYDIIGVALSLSKTVWASKILPVAACFGTVALMFAMRREGSVTAFHMSLFAGSSLYAFWTRADPFLVLATALGAFAVLRLPHMAAALVVGVLTGLATGMKLHAALYFLPLAAMLLASGDRKTWIFALGVGGALLAAAAAFQFDPDRFARMAAYLLEAQHHGVRPHALLAETLPAAVVLALPLLVARTITPTTLAAAISLLVVAVIAAKPGAGAHHLMPFIPVMLLIARPTPLLAPVASLAAILPLWFVATELAAIYRSAPERNAEFAEASALGRRYPDAEFGPSDQLLPLNARAGAALQGMTPRWDLGAWNDLDFAGLKIADDLRLRGCSTWILPKGPPFAWRSTYTRKSHYPDFETTHRVIWRGQRFDVWSCR